MPLTLDVVIIFLIGLFIGVAITIILFRNLFKSSGDLVVDTTDEEVDRYSIMLSIPFELLPKKKMISLRIVNRK